MQLVTKIYTVSSILVISCLCKPCKHTVIENDHDLFGCELVDCYLMTLAIGDSRLPLTESWEGLHNIMLR